MEYFTCWAIFDQIKSLFTVFDVFIVFYTFNILYDYSIFTSNYLTRFQFNQHLFSSMITISLQISSLGVPCIAPIRFNLIAVHGNASWCEKKQSFVMIWQHNTILYFHVYHQVEFIFNFSSLRTTILSQYFQHIQQVSNKLKLQQQFCTGF